MKGEAQDFWKEKHKITTASSTTVHKQRLFDGRNVKTGEYHNLGTTKLFFNFFLGCSLQIALGLQEKSTIIVLRYASNNSQRSGNGKRDGLDDH